MRTAIRNPIHNEKGLTLVELLAVIVILGVIAAIAVPAIGGVIKNSRENADTQTEQLIKDTALRYLTDLDPDGDGNTSSGTPVLTLSGGAGTLNVTALVPSYLRSVPRKQSESTPTWYSTIPVTYSAANGWEIGAGNLGTTTTAP
ncbi:type II secretion system protein [Paenibacillus sp. GYB003]|uniref:type II secretion system protein n=1 Tax=Paenibacillus sp. GYB003 TaxID=2994392 RepID=UPI002F963705